MDEMLFLSKSSWMAGQESVSQNPTYTQTEGISVIKANRMSKASRIGPSERANLSLNIGH